jgi:hypothetical protein
MTTVTISLQAFINQVMGLTPSVLTAMQAQMLIDAANEIRAAIGCSGSSSSTTLAVAGDFDGDGRTDFSVLREQQGIPNDSKLLRDQPHAP